MDETTDNPYAAPNEAIESSEPTEEELAAAAAGHQGLLDLWEDADEGVLVDAPFALVAVLCPPGWLAYRGAFREAGLTFALMATVWVVAPLLVGLVGLPSLATPLAGLSAQVACGIWAHQWLYTSVVRRIDEARGSSPESKAHLEHIAGRSGPFPSVAVAVVGSYIGLWIATAVARIALAYATA